MSLFCFVISMYHVLVFCFVTELYIYNMETDIYSIQHQSAYNNITALMMDHETIVHNVRMYSN